jgi:hypothetical protein
MMMGKTSDIMGFTKKSEPRMTRLRVLGEADQVVVPAVVLAAVPVVVQVVVQVAGAQPVQGVYVQMTDPSPGQQGL